MRAFLSKLHRFRSDLDWQQRVGALFWMLGIQYYISEWYAGRAYRPHYNYLTDYMSVLGKIVCDSAVCSPRHQLMNASFIVEGLIFFLGMILLRNRLPRNAAARFGEVYVCISNLSLFGLGIFTEERIRVHKFFAICHIVLGALGMLMMSAGYMNRARRKVLAILLHINGLAVLGSIALLMATGYFSSIPEGLIERVSAYSVTDWMIIMGFVIFFRSLRVPESPAKAPVAEAGVSS